MDAEKRYNSRMGRLKSIAWGVLAWNLAVILWGAYVRATGSGAGCGAHWPLCNGEVIPRSPSAEMLVEFSHRVTSGLALLAVVALAFAIRRLVPRPHARVAAAWSVAFMLTEAAVGAGLVLFQLVADNASMARALFMSVHLLNTFALVACLALTAWFLSSEERFQLRAAGLTLVWVVAGAAAIGVTGVSGAVAALGDTLYPSGSLTEALAADLSATSALLIRLRVLHPLIAVGLSIGLIAGGLNLLGDRRAGVSRMGSLVAALAFVQVIAGFVNVMLLAPVWMQLVHLLVADILWISYVILSVRLLGSSPRLRAESSAAGTGAATA